MTRHKLKYLLWSAIVSLSLASCMKWDYGDAVEEFNASGAGLFITNEGNFQYGNATLSYYDPATKTVQNEIFFRANGMKLGDVAQSMCIHDGKGWVVVNNSHVIFAIDLNTFKEVGRIENLTSPRYIHFLSDEKAYVTQLWDNRIFIINPKKYEITGYIQVPDMTMESGSTEQMVQYGKYVYCNCAHDPFGRPGFKPRNGACRAFVAAICIPANISMDHSNAQMKTISTFFLWEQVQPELWMNEHLLS